jgi:hypothetical protein
VLPGRKPYRLDQGVCRNDFHRLPVHLGVPAGIVRLGKNETGVGVILRPQEKLSGPTGAPRSIFSWRRMGRSRIEGTRT